MLIDTCLVADLLGQPDSEAFQPHIELAEAVLAGLIGVETLDARTLSESFRPYYDMRLLAVSDGPIESITSITEDGAELDLSTVTVRRWSIRRADLFLSGKTYVVTGVAGWSNDSAGNTTPPQIQQAIATTAAKISQNPTGDLMSEKIGDYSYTRFQNFSTMGQSREVVPEEAALAIVNFIRPRISQQLMT